jgi:hypothetical protein
MNATAYNSICRKKSGSRPKTASLGFSGCNALQCAALTGILPTDQILSHPNRVPAMEVAL